MKEGLEKEIKKLDSSEGKDGETTTSNSDGGKKKSKEERLPTKVVVRRLPPTMTEEEFRQQVDPLPAVDYMYYVPADNVISNNPFCRAYINFTDIADVFIFSQKFDGYVFVDNKGMEYPAIVEFAPFQRIPKLRTGKKKDLKTGTLETEPAYVSFLDQLETENQERIAVGNTAKQHFFETNVDPNEDKKAVTTTPLLDFLRVRHTERMKVREEKRKKDMERRRARDEQRRNAKKPEEDSSLVKVLPSQSGSKDRAKDYTRSTKKREERVKDTKGKTSKTYAEERQRYMERREEQRKKLGGIKVSRQKSSNPPTAEAEANNQNEGKADDSKPNGDDTKKDLQSDKKGSQPRSEDTRRRGRDYDRVNKAKDQRDRKEDRFSTRKRLGDKKYDKCEDSTRDTYKKEHSSKQNKTNSNEIFEKKDGVENKQNTQDNCIVSNSIDHVKEVDCTLKAEEKEAAETVDDEGSCEEEKSEIKSANSNESVGNLTSINDLESRSTDCTVPDELHSKPQRRNSLESCKDLLFLNWGKSENCDDSDLQSEMVRRNSLGKTVSVTFVSRSPPCSQVGAKTDSCKDNETGCSSVKECGLDEEKPVTEENLKANDVDSERSTPENCKEDEVIVKRRNSIELCDRKDIVKKDIRLEPMRRNSLESGDLKTKIKSRLVKEQKPKEKKVDAEERSKPKDPRTVRRIRNKDRPTMELYRPGMGRLSKQKLEREKVLGSSTEVDSNSPSPSPTLIPKHKTNQTNNLSKDTKECEK